MLHVHLPEEAFLRRKAEPEAEARQAAYRLTLMGSAPKRSGKKATNIKFDVDLKTLPERYAATVRMVIPSCDQEGLLWNTRMAETAGMKPACDDPCYCCAIFHDARYKENDAKVQKTLQGIDPDTGNVGFRMPEAVTMASTLVRGSLALTDEANAAVAARAGDNGYAFDGPMFNIYHVSPHEPQHPDEYVTDVCYPVRKA